MKTYYRPFLLVISLIFILLGCDERKIYFYEHPHVVMKSVTTVDSQDNSYAKIYIEFENIGEEHAYDLAGNFSIHIGNTMLESRDFFLDGINAGGTVTAEIWLTSINTHNEYEFFSLEFGWYDYWDNYYYE